MCSTVTLGLYGYVSICTAASTDGRTVVLSRPEIQMMCFEKISISVKTRLFCQFVIARTCSCVKCRSDVTSRVFCSGLLQRAGSVPVNPFNLSIVQYIIVSCKVADPL